ncbi:MAG TPA: histidine kinase dimerization/phosphoacceptor domain -containing protein [Polyangia bacterium]|nr:histidine kinase dimerization/phosphoacceptor domain -containing protein [Polyangia bacterium]
MTGATEVGEIPPAAYAQALGNILEDFGAEKLRLEDTQRAILNIADDGEAERALLRESQRAVLNVLDDLGAEKALLEKTQIAVLRSEQTVRASLKEKEVLLKEIHHRVKNNLQVISSLLNLQARYLPDPAARAIFSQSQNRVQSIALVHERLYESADLSHVDFGKYLAVLLDNVFDTYDAAGRGIVNVIDVGDVHLTVDVAIPCGLIVNELVTNAIKHAFPNGRTGEIRVSLSESPEGTLNLSVQDDGVGIPAGVDPRHTVSLGLDLVVTFAEQLNAEVTITRTNGTCFGFRFRKLGL